MTPAACLGLLVAAPRVRRLGDRLEVLPMSPFRFAGLLAVALVPVMMLESMKPRRPRRTS